MIERQKEYEAFVQERNVGANDKVADSVKSYVSYLNSVSRHLNISINSKQLNSQCDIENISNDLVGKVKKSTIQNYRVAMKHYVEMVSCGVLNPASSHLNRHGNSAVEQSECVSTSAHSDINALWLKYNEYSNKLADALGRTSNIVGEYAEYLAHKKYGGSILKASTSSSDIKALDGKLYQIKARKIKKPSTSGVGLGIIRSWDFDFLVVIIFDMNGAVKLALEVPVEVAEEYGVKNKHQHGWVITTNKKFISDIRSKDISNTL